MKKLLLIWKIVVLLSFLTIVTTGSYWLAGIMTVFTAGVYALEYYEML